MQRGIKYFNFDTLALHVLPHHQHAPARSPHRALLEMIKATLAKEVERASQIVDADKRRDEERSHLQEAFMNRQIQSDGKARLRAALLHAGQRGDNHLQVFTFPSELCTDGGRAINNGDPDWPATPVCFAQRAYDFYRAELQPHGYRLRAEIVNFPGGKPGDVAVTLSW